ncbi:MAG: hypothetical protein IJI60_05410 [Bacilli bacterium]|nr:hypothetical protein [Bacilli bacterium]
MNLRKLAYTIMTLSFILIVSGSVASFVSGLKKDRQETYKRMNDVNNTFEVFSTNVTIFESTREELYNTFTGLYYDTMYQQNKEVTNQLSNFEQLVDELTKSTQELNRLCGNNIYYPEDVANSRCSNYKNIYEQVVNYFVSDINFYNNKVEKYNEYQSSMGTLLRIKKYTTDKKFIDYNEDNQYDGKEE